MQKKRGRRARVIECRQWRDKTGLDARALYLQLVASSHTVAIGAGTAHHLFLWRHCEPERNAIWCAIRLNCRTICFIDVNGVERGTLAACTVYAVLCWRAKMATCGRVERLATRFWCGTLKHAQSSAMRFETQMRLVSDVGISPKHHETSLSRNFAPLGRQQQRKNGSCIFYSTWTNGPMFSHSFSQHC